MNRYTIEQLGEAATYAADDKLATLARRVATASTEPAMATGDRKRLALAGGMAAQVHAAVTAACDAEDAAAAQDAANRQALAAIALPEGWTLTIGDVQAELKGPASEVLHASLSRNGKWDARAGVWRVDVADGQRLARSLKRQAGPAASAARRDVDRARRRKLAEQWLGYVEDAAGDGRDHPRARGVCAAHGIGEFADLAARLDAAQALATRRAAEISLRRREAIAKEQPAAAGDGATTRAAAPPRERMLFALTRAPALGQPVRWGARVVVFTASGAVFRIDENHPSLWGSHLLGHEGERGAYYYFRAASPDEEASLAEPAAVASAAASAAPGA